MTAAIPSVVSEEEYLHNPEYEHCEYVDGQAVPINMGSEKHSTIQFTLAMFLGVYLRQHRIGQGATELRCSVRVRGKHRFRLPDLSVVLGERLGNKGFLEGAAELVIEIRSPDDSLRYCYRKMEEYLEAGSRLGWLILPEDRSAIVFLPGGVTRVVGAGETLDGGDVLPGFELVIDELF